MKKSTLLNFLDLSSIRDYVLIEKENGFKMDFSQANPSQARTSSITENSVKKSGLSSMLLLVVLFFFTNFLFAQPPACNLQGPLKASFSKANGQVVTFSSEVSNAVPGTKYQWSFKSNTTNAKFTSATGQPTMSVASGTKGGSYTVQLRVITPGKNVNLHSCTCTQSVSVNNNTPTVSTNN